MKVTIEGIGEKTIRKNMFVAEGGEARVFVSSGVAYKVYKEPGKCIPEAKIREFSAISDPRIVKPERLIRDAKQQPIGHTMASVPYSLTLCHLFPRSFLTENSVTMDKIHGLVTQLYEVTQHAHDSDCLIVDHNELNTLVSDDVSRIAAIDVSAWQTKSFPATAIMDSIRDRHVDNHDWSVGSDWFSWAILTFQLWTGQHPYKGRHPNYKGKVADRMNERMRDNVSVNDPLATVPPVCGSFDVIPKALKDYYWSTFDNGTREVPPFPFDAPVVQQVKRRTKVVSGGAITMTLKEEFSEPIRRYHCQAVMYGDKCRYQGVDYDLPSTHKALIADAKTAMLLSVQVEDDCLRLVRMATGKVVWSVRVRADAVVEIGDHAYVVSGGRLSVVRVTGLRPVANILPVPQAVHVLDGTVMQNLLGRWHVAWLPAPERCHMVGLPELDGMRIVTGVMRRNLLVVAGLRDSIYHRYEFRFAADGSWDTQSFHDVESPVVNFTVNEAGIAVLVSAADEVHVFSSDPGARSRSVVPDACIDGSWRLWTDGLHILASRDGELCQISMGASK